MNHGHFLAADLVMEEIESSQRDAFLNQITNPAMRRALEHDPVVLAWLERITDGWRFCDDSEKAGNHARAVLQATLGAAGAVAGSLGATAAGKARGVLQRAALAPRDEKVRDLWAGTDPTRKNNPRARWMQRLLWKRYRVEISARQILRIIGRA